MPCTRARLQTVFTAGLLYLSSLITGLIITGKTMGVLGLALTLPVAKTIQAISLYKNER